MRKPSFLGKIQSFFLDRPLPDGVFQVDARYLSALGFSRRERSITGRFSRPLASGTLQASFDRKNIADGAALEVFVDEAVAALGLSSSETISLLIPDPCVRILILAAESLPASLREREAFVRWRIQKQMPLLSADLRMDYAIVPGAGPEKILVAVALEDVVREYEELFKKYSLRIGTVTLPSLSLNHLFQGDERGTDILVNVEADHFSLLAVTGQEWSLFRQKAAGADGRPTLRIEEKVEQIAKEVENTIFFLEDKEKQQVDGIWIRTGFEEDAGEFVRRLKTKIPLPIEEVGSVIGNDWDLAERTLLAPLVGQVS